MNTFRHFHPRVRQALVRAEQLAGELGHRETGPLHLLHALLEGEPEEARALAALHPLPEAREPEAAGPPRVIHTRDLKAVLDAAAAESGGSVTPTHLLPRLVPESTERAALARRWGRLALFLLGLTLGGAAAPASAQGAAPRTLKERIEALRRKGVKPIEAPGAPALVNLSRARLLTGDPHGALEAAREGLRRVDPEDGPARAEATLELGRAYAALEEWDLARRALEECLNADPDGALEDEALYSLARLEARGLPAPEDLRAIVHRFIRQDPLTLDEDAMNYFLGFSKGLRLRRADESLEAMQRVWEEAPGGARVDRARLHAAIIQGLALDQGTKATAYLDALEEERPHSALLGLAALARAFFHLADGEIEAAMKAVTGIPPQDDHSVEGSMLGAMLAGYYLADGDRALYFLDHVEREGRALRALGRYHRALITLVRLEDFAGALAALAGVEGDESLPASWVDGLRTSIRYILEGKDPQERALRFARFFEQHGHYPRARYEYEEVLQADPEGPAGDRARLRLAALEQDDRGRFGPEIAALEKVVRGGRLGPALSAEARWRLARARLELGVEPDRVFREEESSADTFSDSALRGLLLNSDSTDPERLRILWELSEEMDSADAARPRVLGTLAESLEAAGEWDQALQAYHEVLPDSPDAAKRIHKLMDRSRVRALSPDGAEPRSPSKRTRLALYHLRLGEVEKAESLLEGARREAEGEEAASARAAAYLARLLHRRGGRPERIREALDDALARAELPQRDRYVLMELKAGRLQEDEPEEARRILKSLVKQGYRVRHILPGLVRDTRDEKGAVAALALFRLLVGKMEPDPALAALVAELYDETEQDRRARDARVRLVRRWPESPEAARARVQLADLHAKGLRKILMSPLGMGRKAEALREFLEDVGAEDRARHRLVIDEFAERFAEELPLELHAQLGEIYLEHFQDARRALPHLRRARGLPGETGEDAWLVLARAQKIAGDLRGAYGTYGRIAERSSRHRAVALHAQAKLQEESFGDPAEAFAHELSALESDPGEELLMEIARGLARNRAAAEADPAELSRALGGLLARLRGSEGEGEVRRLLARTHEEAGSTREAGREWLRAAARLREREAVDAALRGLRHLLKAKLLGEVQREASRFLGSNPGLEGAEEIRVLLRKASARTQVKTVLASIDWGDPESRANRDKLWRAAQLLVNPLEDYRSAATRLQELVQLFPGSAEARRAQDLLRKLPVLEGTGAPEAGEVSGADADAAAPLTDKRRAEDRLAAARFVEYRLGDRARAAEAYRALFEEDRGVVGVYAGIALLRLLTLEPGTADPAWKLVDRLRQREVPSSLEARFRGRLAALAARDRWVRLEVRSRGADLADRDRALARMVELAAASFQDGPLAMGALRRIKDRGTKFEAALKAAAALDPTAAPAPEATGAPAFLDFAVQVAPGPERRARALVARALHREATPAPARALPDYREAVRLSPASEAGEEALFRKARLQLELGEDLEEALDTLNRLVEEFPGGERYLVAAENAGDLARRLQARKLDSRAAREGPRDPTIYFHTARLLAEKYEALSESLENYRTYLRVGDRPSMLVKAHLEAAEVLVRMEKPAEALLTLERLERQALAGIDHGDVKIRRARIYELEMARLEEAEKLYRKVLEQHPDTAAAKAAREGVERIEGLRDEAELGPLTTETGDAPAELEAIRDEYLRGRRKNYRGAADALQAAIDRSRSRADKAALTLELAQIEDRNLKRYEEAAAAYESYLRVSRPGRHRADIVLRLARIYAQELEKWEPSDRHYTRFLGKYHSHRQRVPATVEHGKVLERLDRVQEALQIYQIVVDSFPRSGNDEVALERLAYLKRTYFAAFQEAVDAYRELINRFPFSRLADDAQYAIGRIYEIELGNLTQAKIEYEAVIQRYPTSEYFGLAQQGLTRIARQ